ncbi:MAG: HAD-IB family hydrolase [Pseudomonadota bacterium]
MAGIAELLADIEASPDGPEVAAVFDFDGTIIAGYSATHFIREQVRRGDLSPTEFVSLARAMASFGMGNLGFSAMMTVSAQFMRGIQEDTYNSVGEELYRKQIARLIYPESRALVDAHLAKGHTVGIISSATPYQVEPAAADLGVENVMCTQLEVENGRFTGSVVSPTCFGQGKVDAAEKLAGLVGADLDDSFFYSDSTDDLLLLERVGKPRALNPNNKLDRIARERNWPVARFGSRGRPTMGQFIRSIAATSSLVTSFAAGLPIWALTGSRRAGQNFSFSLFADTASALIGMNLRVKGEEHLWSERPAVFVFNPQSKADFQIIAGLLRRDIAGIGKKEIKTESPLIGLVLEMGGVVFIDRADGRSAIKAIEPLIEVMRKEGKSVVLAPEGTRTVSPKLAPFKKGAFHIAMQAGVPIVPIVIRNALDVAPKGDFVFRSATVDVQVLPPVDTSRWQRETINDHVRDVRNMFLRTLGQDEEEDSPKKPRRKTKTKAKAKTKTKAQTKAQTKAKARTQTSAKQRPRNKTQAKARPKAQRRTGRGGPAKVQPKNARGNARTKAE